MVLTAVCMLLVMLLKANEGIKSRFGSEIQTSYNNCLGASKDNHNDARL